MICLLTAVNIQIKIK